MLNTSVHNAQDIHHTETNEHFMIFTITGEPVDTGAVIGGTIPGFIALMALVIFLLYKRRKFYIRYMIIRYIALKRTLSFEMQ